MSDNEIVQSCLVENEPNLEAQIEQLQSELKECRENVTKALDIAKEHTHGYYSREMRKYLIKALESKDLGSK